MEIFVQSILNDFIRISTIQQHFRREYILEILLHLIGVIATVQYDFFYTRICQELQSVLDERRVR